MFTPTPCVTAPLHLDCSLTQNRYYVTRSRFVPSCWEPETSRFNHWTFSTAEEAWATDLITTSQKFSTEDCVAGWRISAQRILTEAHSYHSSVVLSVLCLMPFFHLYGFRGQVQLIMSRMRTVVASAKCKRMHWVWNYILWKYSRWNSWAYDIVFLSQKISHFS